MTHPAPPTAAPIRFGAAEAERIVRWIRTSVPAGAQLRIDSRQVAPGDAFLALPGRRSDGRSHIGEAIARGACAVVADAGAGALPALAVPACGVDGLAGAVGAIAAAYYGDPTAQLTTIGVTGTNGKTSCSHWIAQLLSACGQPCAVIGTVGSGFPGQVALDEATLTTPDAVSLQADARRFADRGARALAMEVSSIGLDQGRVDGIRFDHALFTNLTRDHLDYHGSMQQYEQAKARLFDAPGLSHAVLNLDDECGRRFARRCASHGIATTGYRLGASPPAAAAPVEGLALEICGESIELDAQGVRFDARLSSAGGAVRTLPIQAPVIGRFNVSNVLGVLGIALAAGVEAPEAVRALAALRAPPGRLQMISPDAEAIPGADPGALAAGPLVLVDYAHTPDAITQALDAIVPVARRRNGLVWIVFGAGGDRDAGKRPQMGAAAARGADRVVITSDNPRSEDPQRIIDQVAQGAMAAGAAPLRITDRGAAIERALCDCAGADVVLIAGKGHETYQEVAGRRLPFSDADCARRCLRLRPQTCGGGGP